MVFQRRRGAQDFEQAIYWYNKAAAQGHVESKKHVAISYLQKEVDTEERAKQVMLINSLTVREKECLQYLYEGLSSKEIAKITGISPRTVERHFENIKLKFNCTKITQLLTKVTESRIFTPYSVVIKPNINGRICC